MSDEADVGNDSPRRSDYEETVEGLEAFGVSIANLLTALLSEKGINFHSVSHRVKAKSSASRKLEKKSDKYTDYSSLTDLLGLRVITYFEDGVDEVGQLIEKEFHVDKDNSVDKRELLLPDKFGYMSLHYVLQLDDRRTPLVEYRSFSGVKFELQIRSILQHAWAEIEHDLGYKGDDPLPTDLRRRFFRLAGLLEVADSEFLNLREAVVKYGSDTKRDIEDNPSVVPLNGATARIHLKTNRLQISLERSIARIFKAKMRPKMDRFYIARQAKRLSTLGVKTVEDLKKVVQENKDEILKFVQVYTADFNLDEQELFLPRGISYLYVYYFLLAGADAESVRAVAELPGESRDGFDERVEALRGVLADVRSRR